MVHWLQMKDPITNFAEARQELNQVRDSVARLEDFFRRFESFVGGGSPAPVSEMSESTAQRIFQEGPTMTEMVLGVFDEAGHGAVLAPAQVADALSRKGVNKPHLYNATFNAMQYLTTKKNILERVEEGKYRVRS